MMERFFDVIFSGLALLVLSPLLVPIVLILMFSGEGEIFFFQERIGKDGKVFKLFKFATMLKDSLNMGTGSITLENDFRVTKFGKFLRKTKINELPQLLNIFKGDITLVGPRPLVKRTFFCYSDEIQSKIYNVKPGLTGIGSIVFRDEESIISMRSNNDPHEFYKSVIAPYKGDLEIWYQKNKSFLLDLKLIFLTAWVVFFPKSKLYYKWFRNLPKRNF